MITSPLNFSARQKRHRGFTLVEVIIAATIGSFVLAGVMASFLMLVRSGVRTSNYSVMETETRRAFEQLGIDARMANAFTSTFTGSTITAFTLTIPNNDLTGQRQVMYGYDTSDSTNYKFYIVPVPDTTPSSRRVLVNKVSSLTFLRYDSTGALIPSTTPSDANVKHIQVSVSVRRAEVGVAQTTQIIRSSAFTIRNISI